MMVTYITLPDGGQIAFGCYARPCFLECLYRNLYTMITYSPRSKLNIRIIYSIVDHFISLISMLIDFWVNNRHTD